MQITTVSKLATSIVLNYTDK